MKIGYCRVSTKSQYESLGTQRELLAQKGCNRFFDDIASGARASRPGLAEALKFARPGDILMVTRLDRLGRSVLDTLRTVEKLDQQGIVVQALDTNLDTSTPTGRLMLNLMATLAQYERDLLAERTKEGLAHARAQGRVGGRPRKLDEAQRSAALSSLGAGMSENEVARAFGVSRPTISRLKAELARKSLEQVEHSLVS